MSEVNHAVKKGVCSHQPTQCRTTKKLVRTQNCVVLLPSGFFPVKSPHLVKDSGANSLGQGLGNSLSYNKYLFNHQVKSDRDVMCGLYE